MKKNKNRFRETLVFVTGTTPQIVTETIYGLMKKRPRVMPDELFIITTSHGEEVIRKLLLESGIFQKFSEEFNIRKDIFRKESLRVITDRRGRPLNDIISEKDSEAAGDFISSFIRELAGDQGRRLHCSIAGGRKTMSFYMGSALQLFGRPWDRLYHVLVHPDFESHPDFFYKPAVNEKLQKGKTILNTDDAWIYLCELPVIRLGTKVSLNGRGFRELVREGQLEIDMAMMQHDLIVKRAAREIRIGPHTFRLTPLHMMIYLAYLRYKLQKCKHPGRPYCFDCTDCFPSIVELATRPALEEMAKDYLKMAPSRVDDLLYKHKNGLSMEILRSSISKIKRRISSETNDETLASCYAVTAARRDYANTRYGVRIEKGKIRIE
jgi:CRISPR-associated protein Csx14